MITPHPTSKIDPALARGTLGAFVPPTATKAAYLTFLVPNTNYELHLLPQGLVTGEPGKRLIGVIAARARRIDVVDTGGQFLEPVMGRPRRIQGTVLAVRDGAVIVDAGVPVHCTPTHSGQSASDFAPGQLVSFDAMDGATFTVA